MKGSIIEAEPTSIVVVNGILDAKPPCFPLIVHQIHRHDGHHGHDAHHRDDHDDDDDEHDEPHELPNHFHECIPLAIAIKQMNSAAPNATITM